MSRKQTRTQRPRTTVDGIMPEFYLRRAPNALETHPTLDAHFADVGFSSNLDPNALTSIEYCRRIASQDGLAMETAGGLLAFCKSISINSVYSTHPLICPAWMSFQLGVQTGELDDLYNMAITADWFSPHPMICPVPLTAVKEDEKAAIVNVQHVLRFLRRSIASYSILDLSAYGKGHRDLSVVTDDLYGLAIHFLREGMFQNRLKNFDISLPRSRDYGSTLSVFLSKTIERLRESALVECIMPGGSLDQLPSGRDLHYSRVLNHLERLRGDREAAESGPGPLDSILVNASAATSISVGFRVVFPYVYKSVGVRSILDTDLAIHSRGRRKVAYSVNIGGYDDFSGFPRIPGYTYYLLTDQPTDDLDPDITLVRPTIREADVKRACLWYKTHPHMLFPDAEACVWLDGNIISGAESSDILLAHEVLSELATFHHPDRNCIYEEAKVIIDKRLDEAEVIKAVVKNLQAENFPEHYGLFETNVLFSRANDLGVRLFFDEWWFRIAEGSRRDQMSFTPAAWRHGVTVSQLDGRHSARTSRTFAKSKHVNPIGRDVE